MTNEFGFEIPLVSEQECKLQERIENLEKENERLRTRCEQARDEGTGYMQQLEQENSTLKKQLEALSGDIPWSELKDVSEVTKKLTEAREIISEFVKWANWQGSKCPSFKSILDKAEQFIKE